MGAGPEQQNESSTGRRPPIAARAALAGMLHGGGAALMLIVSVLLARWMAQGDYGRFALAMSTANCLSGFAGLGLATAVLRFFPQYEARGETAKARGAALLFWRWTLVAGCVLAGVVAAGLGLGSAALGAEVAGSLWIAFGFVPLLAIACYQMELARALGDLTAAYLPFRVLWPCLLLGGTATFALGGAQIRAGGVLLTSLVLLAGILLVQAAYLWSKINRQCGDSTCIAEREEWLSVSRPLWLQSSASTALRTSDVILVGVFLSPAEVGVYFAATRVAAVVGFLLFAINAVVAPMIPQLYFTGQMQRLQEVAYRATAMAFWPSAIVCAALFLFAEPVLSVFGEGYAAGATILRLLLVGQLVNSATGAVGYLMNLTGHQSQNTRIYTAAAALQVLLAIALAPLAGGVGAATATCLAVVAWNITSARAAARLTGVSPTILSPVLEHRRLTDRQAA